MAVVIDGSAGVTTNAGAVYNGIQSGTAVASTSGTSIDFTSIPSWVKRITVMFNGVSLAGNDSYLIRLGVSGTPQTTGYVSASGYVTAPNGAGSAGGVNSSAGFVIQSGSLSYVQYGSIVFTTLGSNIWVSQGVTANTSASGLAIMSAGGVTLSGTLNMVRITTVGGTDTFDAGSINILYE